MIAQLGQPAYRAGQLFRWLHRRGAAAWAEMTDLPRALTAALAEKFPLPLLEIADKRVSQIDGTVKYLYRLQDGEHVEAVVMPYSYGNSICISTQVGCKMGCVFCASTGAGFRRDLTAGEMLSEIYAARRDLGMRVSKVVLMGIGEPLDNFDCTARFLQLVSNPEGFGLSLRNLSLSTCGVVEGIDRLAELDLDLTLSISLHGATDAVRSRLMPHNRRDDIEELLRACRRYADKTRRRITFEYILLAGVNDSPEDAAALSKLLRGMICHVNLIPANRVFGSALQGSGRAAAVRFQETLTRNHISATVRRTMGADIAAACGQLRRSTQTGSEHNR